MPYPKLSRLVAVFFAITLLSAVSGQESGTSFSLPDNSATVGCAQHLQSGNNRAAVSSASVLLTRNSQNDRPESRFTQLVCRGQAYEALADAGSAERDYREALRLAARHFDPFDVRMVDPLTYLGRLRLSAADSAEAELLLLQARDITHRNAGIFNIEQKAVLDDLTRVFMQQGRSQQANRQQQLRLRSARETFGENSPELVQALHDFARWNAIKGDFPKVRKSLEEAVSILESTYGANDPRLISTLRLRAQLYILHPTIVNPKAGIEALQRVVDIYAAQEFVDHVDLLNARTDIGDFHLKALRYRKAIKYYKKSVKQSIAENVDPELIDSLYGAPKLMFFDTERKGFYGRDVTGALLKSGFIRVRYSVGANGKTRNVQVMEDTVGVPVVQKEIIHRVDTAAFRPRFVNGKATITHNVEQRFDIKQTGSGLETSTAYLPILIEE